MEKNSCFNCERYKQMKVREGVYLPEIMTLFPDDDPSKRILETKIIREIEFDDTYPYLDERPSARFNRFLYDIKAYLCAFLNWVIYGLKVENSKVLKEHEVDFKNGAITVANHQYRWDVPSVRWAIGMRKLWTPAWAETFKTKEGANLVGARCIPIPTSMKGLKKFNEAIDKLRSRKQWFHIFPEGTRWDFYKPFKPFHKGAFVWAYKFDLPIVPLAFQHRERTGWRKLFHKGEPLMTLIIGEPMFADKSLPRKEAVDKLRKEVYEKMLDMAGIEVNPWPMIPEVDN